MRRTWIYLCMVVIVNLLFFCHAGAQNIFDMEIKLTTQKRGNPLFNLGNITARRLEKNYIMLDPNVRTFEIDLHKLDDFKLYTKKQDNLNNTHLKMVVENWTSVHEKFSLAFSYDKHEKNIRCDKEGNIEIEIDNSEYYPKLIIRSRGMERISYLDPNQRIPAGKEYQVFYKGLSYVFKYNPVNNRYAANIPIANINSDNLKIHIDKFKYECSIDNDKIRMKEKPFLFFDLNHRVSYLRREHFSTIEKLLNNPGYYYFFYYYKSDGYKDDSLIIHQNTSEIDSHKLGLSEEKKDIAYYLNIIKKIRVKFGVNFTNKIIIVSEYGKSLPQLKEAVKQIGIKMDVEFRSYKDKIQ